MFRCLSLVLLWCLFRGCFTSKKELKLLHIIFRHGDVTNGKNVYPKDPYKNETYYPFGYGQLTNKGKLREFNLGQKIRDYYGDFLDKTYYPGLIHARSTIEDRTKSSLELVLAGLFPPTQRLQWNKSLKWQPIPYDFFQNDLVLSGRYTKEYQKAEQRHQNSTGYKRKLHKMKGLFDYLSENSGWDVDNFKKAKRLYQCFKIEQDWGFELPEWSRSVFPGKLHDIVVQDFKEHAATTDLKKYGSGYFLNKVINDTKSLLNATDWRSSVKLFLYSAHKSTLAAILLTLGVFDSKVPDYGSYIVFEVYQMGYQTYWRVLYGKTYSKPDVLVLPGCQEYCLLEKFVGLYKGFLP